MQLVAYTVALLVGCGLAAAAVPPTIHLNKRHNDTYCRSYCSLAGVAMPDQDTIQLPLENNYSEQCPPLVAGSGASQVNSKACITFPGTSMDFALAPFPGYKIQSATVTWKIKGNAINFGAWTLPPPVPPTADAICVPNAATGGASCTLPFSTIFYSPWSPIKDLLGKMCPNGDREGLIFYLEFSGWIKPASGVGAPIRFSQQAPCTARNSNRVCTAWSTGCDHIEITYRCTKCNVSPCPTSSVLSSSVPSSSVPVTA